jgi:hypothetical protein
MGVPERSVAGEFWKSFSFISVQPSGGAPHSALCCAFLQLRARARGTAAATLMNWIQNAIIGKVAPLMLVAIGSYTYAFFAALCAAMTIFSAFCVPETQGVSLEDMEALFGGGGKGARNTTEEVASIADSVVPASLSDSTGGARC